MHHLLRFCISLLIGLLICISTQSVSAQFPTRPVLGLEVAKELAAAATAFALEHEWKVVIAIVDDGGHLIYFARMDGVQTGSIEVAIQKAKTAIAFKRPSKVFEDGVAGGRIALVSLPGVLPIEGGVPIKVGETFIGAIGVSGVTAQQDGMIAQAGADALAALLKK